MGARYSDQIIPFDSPGQPSKLFQRTERQTSEREKEEHNAQLNLVLLSFRKPFEAQKPNLTSRVGTNERGRQFNFVNDISNPEFFEAETVSSGESFQTPIGGVCYSPAAERSEGGI